MGSRLCVVFSAASKASDNLSAFVIATAPVTDAFAFVVIVIYHQPRGCSGRHPPAGR